MPKYTHDSERWLRSNAEWYARKGILQMARNFEMCAEDVNALRNAVEKLQAEAEELRGMGHELAALKEAAVHLYNSGYHAGHHGTVEGSYVDIHTNDMDTYHAEEVAELLAALVGEE